MRRIVILALLLGCSSEKTAPEEDAGVEPDAGSIFQPTAPEPPAAPDLTVLPSPVLTPCPTGWQEVENVCDPWPNGPASCADHEAHFPGEASCVRVGTACPTGDWPEGLPASEVLYVRPGGTGNGTSGSPFGSIAAAVAVSSSGTVIALSKGTFDGAVTLYPGVTLWGACVAETLLTNTISTDATFTLERRSGWSGDAVIENLTISGRGKGIVARQGPASLLLRDLVVKETAGLGIHIEGRLTVDAENIVVRDTAFSNPNAGRGLQVTDRANVTLTRALFWRNRDVCIYAADAWTNLTMEGVAVRDTQPGPNGVYGVGLFIGGGATTEVRRSVLEKNRDRAIWVHGAGANAQLSDLVIRETESQQGNGTDGIGLMVSEGGAANLLRSYLYKNRALGLFVSDNGTLTLSDVIVQETRGQAHGGIGGRGLGVQNSVVDATRVLFDRNREIAVFAAGGDTDLSLTDVVVQDTDGTTVEHDLGLGLMAQNEAKVTVTRALFARNRQAALTVATGAHATLTDVVARDTLSREVDQYWGFALLVHTGGIVEMTRLLSENNRDLSVVAHTAGSLLRGSDLIIRNTGRNDANGGYGRGLEASNTGRLDLTRVVVENSHEYGVLVGTTATATLTDIVVKNTESREPDGMFGRGIAAQSGARIVVRRGVVENNREYAVVANNEGTSMALTDLVVRDTRPNACAQTCDGGGSGVTAVFGAAITLDRFTVSASALAGLQIAAEGSIDAQNGEVFDNPVGVNLQSEDYDIARLKNNVVYRDNDLTLQFSALPVPEEAEIRLP